MKLKRFSKYLVVIIFFLLVIAPIIVQGNLYYVGGDDTRLYYIFPKEFLKNLVFNIISDNTLGGANTGYQPVSHNAPFLYTVLFFKTVFPFVNTQYLMYGLNYAFAFLFFYLFLSIWYKTDNLYTFISKIAASLFYVFSPFLIGTLYRNNLTLIYLISLLPAMFYFFSRAVLEKKYVYSLLTVMIFSVFSTTYSTLPWTLPILMTSIPYFWFIFGKERKSFLINLVILAIVFMLLNLHWLFHFLYSNVNNTGIASVLSYYSSSEFEEANLAGMFGVTKLLNPLVPVLTQFDYLFKKNFSLIYLKNIIFIVIISLAGFITPKDKRKKMVNLYWLSLAGFLTSWFLFSPNFENWGPSYFIKLAKILPYASMFRNMFDKFSLPLAFYYSLLLALSLLIIQKRVVRKTFLTLICFATLAVVLSISIPFLKKKNEVLEGNIETVTGEFDPDFMDVAAYFRDLDNASRVLWVPLTAPNFVSVEDKYLKGHYYSGLSPLRILSGRGDYAGRFSFLIASDLYYGDKLIELLKSGKYEVFAKNIQRMNARYILVDKQVFPEAMEPFLFDIDRKYFKFQNEEYKKVILGDKLKDFGDHYSLYLIKKDYLSDRLYLTEDYTEFPASYEGLKYSKLKSYLYKINITRLKGSKKLVFMDPYFRDWTLYLRGNNRWQVYEKGENVIVHDWANGWEINTKKIQEEFGRDFYHLNEDGSVNLEFILYFEPEKYNKILYQITILSYVGVVAVVITYYLLRAFNRFKLW